MKIEDACSINLGMTRSFPKKSGRTSPDGGSIEDKCSCSKKPGARTENEATQKRPICNGYR